MDHSPIFPKCAKKYLRKVFCASKKPKAKAAPPSPPPAEPPATPPPSPPCKENVHGVGHQPCIEGDCNCAQEFIEQMSRIPGIRNVRVTFGMNYGDPMDDYYYYHEYGRPTRGMLGMPLLVPPPPPSRFLPPVLPPSPPRGMLPSLPEHYGPSGPFFSGHQYHHVHGYPCGAPPPAYFDDY